MASQEHINEQLKVLLSEDLKARPMKLLTFLPESDHFTLCR